MQHLIPIPFSIRVDEFNRCLQQCLNNILFAIDNRFVLNIFFNIIPGSKSIRYPKIILCVVFAATMDTNYSAPHGHNTFISWQFCFVL